jgi:hypothetical protein
MNQAEFDRRYALISERLQRIAQQEQATGGTDATETWARKKQLLDELEQLLNAYERA